MRKIILLVVINYYVSNVFGQEYIVEGKNRLNFAKTYFELGGQFSPSFTGKNSKGNAFSNSSSIVPYLNIGGLHFWGHAEFYISIPLAQLNTRKNDSTNFQLYQSASTGARFLPWAYRENKLRPYIGASWAIANFKQSVKPDENQPILTKNKLLFDAGLLYGKGNFITRLGANFYPSNTWEYPVAQNNFQRIKTPSWGAYFGLIYAFESTRSKNMEAENARLNKFPKVSKPTMNALKKGDYFIGIGPSSSFMLSKSDYNETHFPYFSKKPVSNTFFDIAIGYQFNKEGIVTTLSFRNPKFTNEAFGTTQTIKNNSFVLEAYKFLTDYSGFTPYWA